MEGKHLKEILAGAKVIEHIALPADKVDNSPANIKEEDLVNVGIADVSAASTGDLTYVKVAYLHIQGYSNAEIATTFNVSPALILKIKSSDKFKAIMDVLNEEIVMTAKTYLHAMGLKATKTLIECLDSKMDKIRLAAASQILDRIGVRYEAPKTADDKEKADKYNAFNSKDELIDFIYDGLEEIRGAKKE